MTTGTKSLLFGVHQVFLHPIFVELAWRKLYGPPTMKERVAIVIHDWGYFGCDDLENESGEQHPMWAATFIRTYLGWEEIASLCERHSRFLCRRMNAEPSKLCWADKLASAIMPTTLWVGLARLSGELAQYMENDKHKPEIGYDRMGPREFHRRYKMIVDRLLAELGLAPKE